LQGKVGGVSKGAKAFMTKYKQKQLRNDGRTVEREEMNGIAKPVGRTSTEKTWQKTEKKVGLGSHDTCRKFILEGIPSIKSPLQTQGTEDRL